MQFEIENKIITRETVTLDAPAYYKALGNYYFLTDKFLMKVIPKGIASMDNGTSNHAMYLQDLVKYGIKITQQDFESMLDKQLKCLTEQYQSSIAMIIDPKDPELDETKEQATEGTDAEEGQGALVD